MKNLRAEMIRSNVSNHDIKRLLEISLSSVDNKLKGKTSFTYPEAEKIRGAFFGGMRMEYLFGDEGVGTQPDKSA